MSNSRNRSSDTDRRRNRETENSRLRRQNIQRQDDTYRQTNRSASDRSHTAAQRGQAQGSPVRIPNRHTAASRTRTGSYGSQDMRSNYTEIRSGQEMRSNRTGSSDQEMRSNRTASRSSREMRSTHTRAQNGHTQPASERRKVRQKAPAKIVPYKKPLNINLGMIIFGIIFIYAAICVFMYFSSKHIIGYEVVSGSLSVPNVYKGVALRQEQPVIATQAGYVNFFAREGEHVGQGELVYTVDQSGKIAELINTDNEAIGLSESDLNQLKSDILVFQHQYTDADFSDVYDFQFDLKGAALKLSNYNMLNNVDSISNAGTGIVTFCNAPQSGVVVYSIDGYEEMTPDTISANNLDPANYEKKQLASNALISTNDTVYKLITDENWSILIEVTEERAAQLEAEEYVEVRFLKNQYTSWAKVTILRRGEDVYALLSFTNSMITFATERFIDVEIISNEEEGLKIPNSSIVEKEFYLIPKEYAQVGPKGELNGFLRETYDENGNVSSELVEASIYSESETDYYVDTSSLRIGDYIIMENSQNKYPVSKVGTLIGVYNMDKGYADFKEITVLYSNEEYSIVKSNTQYGLAVYDHIVLDASSVQEDDFLK